MLFISKSIIIIFRNGKQISFLLAREKAKITPEMLQIRFPAHVDKFNQAGNGPTGMKKDSNIDFGWATAQPNILNPVKCKINKSHDRKIWRL